MKALKLCAVFGLLAALLMVGSHGVHAQGGVSWSSTIQVQNLGSADAAYSITFYDQNGATPNGSAINPQTKLGAGKSITYLELSGLSSFNGSAVISSDQPVAAITNLTGNRNEYYDSAAAVSTTASTLRVPLLMRNNGGFNTWVNIQNAGSAPAKVTITYKPGLAGRAGSQEKLNLAQGASVQFDQASFADIGDATTGRFVGSADIVSDQPIAATVGQVGTGNTKSLLLYNAFDDGATKVLAPLIMANNSSYATGISVLNIGTAQTRVKITYTPSVLAGAYTPPADEQTLPVGASYQTINGTKSDWTAGQRYVGGATIESLDGQKIVVVVNQLRGGTGSKGSSYASFDPAKLTVKISTPLLMVNNGGFSTGVQCQNAGTQATTIKFTYSPNLIAGNATPAVFTTANLAPGASTTVFTGDNATPRYVGSAVIESTNGQLIACIVNQLNSTSDKDTLLSYGAINY